jgi:hypothetical protein
MVNSGCFLRQLQPVSPRLKGSPVFVSKFVLTHVRVFVEHGQLQADLWEQPKPAGQRLSRIERLLSWGRRPPQLPPGAKSRVVASVASATRCSCPGVSSARDPGKVEASPTTTQQRVS